MVHEDAADGCFVFGECQLGLGLLERFVDGKGRRTIERASRMNKRCVRRSSSVISMAWRFENGVEVGASMI
jgi:hypothetical protein